MYISNIIAVGWKTWQTSKWLSGLYGIISVQPCGLSETGQWLFYSVCYLGINRSKGTATLTAHFMTEFNTFLVQVMDNVDGFNVMLSKSVLLKSARLSHCWFLWCFLFYSDASWLEIRLVLKLCLVFLT